MSNYGLNRREVLAVLGAAAVPLARADGGLLEVARIDHVSLAVPNIDKAMSFYRTLFGNDVLKDSRTPRRYLHLNPGYIAIAPAPAGQPIRIDHFAAGVKNYNAASLKASLEKAGLKVRETPVGLFVTDPDGTSVQINSDESWKELTNASPEPGIDTAPLFHARGMHHLAIRVTDPEKSAEFYAKLFGPVSRRQGTPPQPWFQAGESGLGLYYPVAGKKPDVDHFCALVDPFDPAAATTKLQVLGADAKLSKNGTLPEFYDPDGIRLQVMSPPTGTKKSGAKK